MKMYGQLEDCLKLLMEDDNDVNGCDIEEFPGRLIAKAFSNTEEKWILSLVDEPLLQSRYTMFFARGSPFADRFYEIALRLSDSGVSKYQYEVAVQNFSRCSTRFMERHNVVDAKKFNFQINLSFCKLIFFLMTGYLLAFFSLVCDILLIGLK